MISRRAATWGRPYRGGIQPPHPPQCAHWGAFPPVRGRLWGRSNREGFVLLWDVWIHILGIRAECACWGAGQSCRGPLIRLAFARHLSLKGKASGRPGVPPLRRRSGTPRRRVREAAPYKGGGGNLPPHPPPSGAPSPPGGRHDGRVSVPALTAYLRTALHIERGTDLGPVS